MANDYNEKLKGLFAGAVSGIIADVVTHPLSTVKTRLQCQGAASAGNIVGKHYRGFFPGLKVCLFMNPNILT